MASQLLSLGLALALIFLIGGHWTDARPQNPYYVENGGQGGFGGPETHHHRPHHGHGYGHGHGHGNGHGHEHGFGHGQGQGVGYGSGFSGGFPPQQSSTYGRYPPPTYPVNQFPGGPFSGQQPGGGHFGNRQPGNVFGGQQPGSNFRPQPGQGGDYNRGQSGFQQPGGNLNRGQTGGDFNRGQAGGDFNGRRQPGFQQPGTGSNRGQPGIQQPGTDTNRSPPGFQQPEGDLNARQPGSNELPTYSPGGFRQTGSGENTLQPRPGPGQSPGRGGGFQQPGHQPGSSSNPIQPRPGNNEEDDFSQFNFQTPNSLQPRPGQNPEAGEASSVIQPIPGQTSTRDNVANNLGDLFNTQDYLSPELSQGVGSRSGSERDPKSETEEARPESVNQRNLFDTDPICTNGTERMAGRCRKKA
ncbi:uncharacterized protein Gbp2 [Drosophila kikkawai]|uniref:Uncharacterized protein Gbp2 n=1 Tax=Drosophila kikkawai TaxID=30033 RepID=A0A6P4IZQ9_DROKI|nr:glutenin, high molecular weight subunit PW212 [Drosophila kikkawai]